MVLNVFVNSRIIRIPPARRSIDNTMIFVVDAAGLPDTILDIDQLFDGFANRIRQLSIVATTINARMGKYTSGVDKLSSLLVAILVIMSSTLVDGTCSTEASI
jgi:hypothetical protein